MARTLNLVTVGHTCRLIREDYSALRQFNRRPHSLKQVGECLLRPGFVAVLLHRTAHYFQSNNQNLIARLIYWLSLVLTGADINPHSEIGGGFVMLHSTGTILTGKIGRNALLTARNGLGGDASAKDIGAGLGLPVLGDNVVMGAGSTVLGPCTIGDGAFIGAMSLVISDVPAGATYFGNPARPINRSNRGAPEAVPVRTPQLVNVQ